MADEIEVEYHRQFPDRVTAAVDVEARRQELLAELAALGGLGDLAAAAAPQAPQLSRPAAQAQGAMVDPVNGAPMVAHPDGDGGFLLITGSVHA